MHPIEITFWKLGNKNIMHKGLGCPLRYLLKKQIIFKNQILSIAPNNNLA